MQPRSTHIHSSMEKEGMERGSGFESKVRFRLLDSETAVLASETETTQQMLAQQEREIELLATCGGAM